MEKTNQRIAGILIGIFCLTCPQASDASEKKDTLKKAAIAAVVLPVGKTQVDAFAKQEKPKTPETPKIELPGLPKEQPPQNKKEARKSEQAAKEAAAKKGDNAFAKVEEMALSGDMQAQYIMGYAAYTGQKIKENDEMALLWWQKAAKQGHIDADAYIGLFYAEGRGGMIRSQKEAMRRYKRAAANGSALAGTLLGINEYDEGDERQRIEASAILRRAAEQGDASAKTFLREILKKGIDAKQNFVKKLDCRKEAKKMPLLALYTRAGTNAFKGRIVPQNYERAVDWWMIADACGDREATALLGTAYYTGRGIEQDYQKAAEYLKTAAAEGQPLAAYTLGKAYLEGNGVKKNNALAIKLFHAAADGGINDARKLAVKLEGRDAHKQSGNRRGYS